MAGDEGHNIPCITTKAMASKQSKTAERVINQLSLVKPIAAHYARSTGQDQDDLIQVGRLGLIRASKLFIESEGNPFTAFARVHIRGAILHYLRDNSGVVKLPRRIQERAQRLIRESAEQSSRANQNKRTQEDEWILAAYRQQRQWLSIDDEALGARCHARDESWQCVNRRERQDKLTQCLQALSKQERQCVQLVILEGQSLRVTAGQLGTSAMTVQRRVRRGLMRLAELCAVQGLSA